jgi:tetratricopeptide (TPR) repeat protein
MNLSAESKVVDDMITTGMLLTRSGKYVEALEIYNKCRDMQLILITFASNEAESELQQVQLCKLYSNMGVTYFEYGKYEDAIDFSKQALSTIEQMENPMKWERCKIVPYKTIGNANFKLGNLLDALKFNETSMSFRNKFSEMYSATDIQNIESLKKIIKRQGIKKQSVDKENDGLTESQKNMIAMMKQLPPDDPMVQKMRSGMPFKIENVEFKYDSVSGTIKKVVAASKTTKKIRR